MSARVLIPSFSDDLLAGMLGSIERSDPGSLDRVVVGDNGLSAGFRAGMAARGVVFVDVPATPFVYAQAVNLMARVAGEDDFIILEDDMVMVTSGWRGAAESVFRNWPGVYAVLQCATQHLRDLQPGVILTSSTTVGMGVTLVPRRVWQRVGEMDERYVGYGWEDTDWCVRALHEGFLLGTTGSVHVDHLKGQQGYTRREGSYANVIERHDENRARFVEKWGRTPESGLDVAKLHLRRACGCRGVTA